MPGQVVFGALATSELHDEVDARKAVEHVEALGNVGMPPCQDRLLGLPCTLVWALIPQGPRSQLKSTWLKLKQ